MKRVYILPIEWNLEAKARGPKYFPWSFDTNTPLFNVYFSMMDYGASDVGILVADLTSLQHLQLIANSDVYAFPEDLNTKPSSGNRYILINFLSANNIPSEWITTSLTYREILRKIMGIFQFSQRFHAQTATSNLFKSGTTLTSKISEISASVKTDLENTARSFGYKTDKIVSASSLNDVLKDMSDQWGDKPLVLGGLKI